MSFFFNGVARCAPDGFPLLPHVWGLVQMTRPEQVASLVDEKALERAREKRRKVDECVSEKVSITKRMYDALDTCIKNIGVFMSCFVFPFSKKRKEMAIFSDFELFLHGPYDGVLRRDGERGQCAVPRVSRVSRPVSVHSLLESWQKRYPARRHHDGDGNGNGGGGGGEGVGSVRRLEIVRSSFPSADR